MRGPDDLDAGVAQVERVRVALAAEADDGDLPVEKARGRRRVDCSAIETDSFVRLGP